MKKSLLATMLAVSLCLGATEVPPVTADAWLSFLSTADRSSLLSKGELTVIGSHPADLVIGAKAPFSAELTKSLSVKDPTLVMEGLFLFSRPATLETLQLYNAVSAVSTMEGLEYYSATRQRMEPMILASYRVASADKPTRLPDPVFKQVPEGQKAIVFQKDNKVGDGLSELTWKVLPSGAVALTFRNLDRLTYGFLPLVEPSNLQMLFVMQPVSDKLVVYGAMYGKTASLFGLERTKDESFRNRMRALASWLGTRIAMLK